MEVFNQPQHFLIPLFQRRYVWDQEQQWEPLWQDIRRVAELQIEGSASSPTHFLGAIVLQAQGGMVGTMTARNVIDGQQRLTTLQIFMDAASAALEDAGEDKLADQLERLTHNDDVFVSEGETRLKIRHLNKDRDAFDEVMNADIPIDYEALKHPTSKIARAHAYFAGEVREWLGDPDEESFARRATALVRVLTQGLQLVGIDLSATENSQAIFETLNARGTPLTAADLIRNFVFQRLDIEGADTAKAYKEDWPFETKFWEKEIAVGRQFIGRSSLFLNQWLASRTGEEISPQSTFTRFKSYVEHEARQKMADLLPVIKQQAEDYQRWTVDAADPARRLGPVEMNVYRMQASGTELLKPLLIWLHEPGRELDEMSITTIVRAAESWVVRRSLLQLTTSDLGRIVADIIKVHTGHSNNELADQVVAHLARLNVVSTYWPGDDEVRMFITSEAVYRKWRRSRLRMILEAIEDHYRAETKQSQLERKGYPIEHILPQSWQDHWPVEDPDAQQDRAEHVHRLGNLTLLTDSLNPKVSNGNWAAKRSAFMAHNTINMTGRLVMSAPEAWDEAAIDARTDELLDVILGIWSVPEGHTGAIVDKRVKGQEWVQIKHLVVAGKLKPGDVLVPWSGQWQGHSALVTDDGGLDVEGTRFWSPSGAAKRIAGRSTNGWNFWRVADGRQLGDLRADYIGEMPGAQTSSITT